jgi:hypothetical protein
MGCKQPDFPLEIGILNRETRFGCDFAGPYESASWADLR